MAGRQDSFGFGVSIPPVAARISDTAADIIAAPPDSIAFQHAVLCQVGMPRRRTAGRTFERSSGRASVQLEAGSLWDGKQWQQYPLPYGTRPRLVMIHVASEAVRTQEREIEVGRSTRDFLLKLGMDTSGRGYARFRTQMLALAACRLSLGMAYGNIAATIDAKPFSRFEAWLSPEGAQGTMWPGLLELSEPFFETLREHAVPLDYRAIAALSHTSLGLDVYTWLAHRLCRVRKQDGVKLSWRNLRGQFGQEYAATKDFKREFRRALRQVLDVYPDARVEPVVGGILLKPSSPPVKRLQVMGGI